MLKARHDTVVSLPEAQLRVGRWHMCAAALTTFARKQPLGVLGGIIPTASFNSLSNVLLFKGVATSRSWLTGATLR
jgi:hypothetical protein